MRFLPPTPPPRHTAWRLSSDVPDFAASWPLPPLAVTDQTDDDMSPPPPLGFAYVFVPVTETM